LKSGNRRESEHLTLRLNKGTPKFSFVVSKKVAAKAVERNRIKRRGYEAINELLKKGFNKKSGVFFAKKGISKLTFKELKEEIKSLLS